MPGQRQDYLLNQIDLLRKFVARLASDRNRASLDEALMLAFQLHEKLFAMPADQFLRQDMHGQIASLVRNETKAEGHEKCLSYAALLQETAKIYHYRGQDDLAAGAHQIALFATLSVALDKPGNTAAVDAIVSNLRAVIEPGDLHPPVRKLLEDYDQLNA